VPYVRELKGQRLQAALDALTGAFDRKSLRAVVDVGLNESLDNIVADGPLEAQVYELLEWARRRGQVTELLQAAVDANPTSPELRKLIGLLQE
jgi:hypothetical protein